METEGSVFEIAMQALTKEWSPKPEAGKEQVTVSNVYITEQIEEVVEVSKQQVAEWMSGHGYELTWNAPLKHLDWIVYEQVRKQLNN